MGSCLVEFMYSAIIGGWCIPGVALTIALAITGVSYRFGNTCHINHDHNIEFWAPVLTVAGATTIIQFTTLAYCVKVYLRSLLDDGIASTNNSAGPPSLASKTLTPRQAYRRMRKIIELQWRGILIVLVFIADVVLFSVVFLYMDNTTQVTENLTKAKPWLVCIVIAGGDKNQCLEPAKKLVVNQATLLAVLILLSINGLWTLVFFFRWSMITCWIELFKEKFSHKREFVSLDAHRYSAEPRTYEMIGKASSSYNISSPTVPEQAPVYSPAGRTSNSYFDSTPTEATWSATKSPLSPSQIDEKDWDPRNTYARGTMWPGSKMI
ncbi:MAG: hypothetical protein M1829_001036 [Trizodia sp. TS-e1964]|nr:MAG: hypothetical protein M1829_001036 [Trizodia sp. TS-e1964]